MNARLPFDPTSRGTRRAALRRGAGLAAVLAAFGVPVAAAQEATPAAGGGLLAVQAFSQGSFFPTQGDGADLPPYTVILWDAADRGVLLLDTAGNRSGLVSSDRVLADLGAADAPIAAIIARPAEDDPAAGVWLLRLVGGELGSDPGAVTYQGEPLDTAAAASLGVESAVLPEGPQDLGAGFLVVSGLTGLESGEGIWLTWP